MGELNDPEYAYSTGYVVGREIRSLGFNINFAPMLDLSEPDNETLKSVVVIE